MKDRFAVSMFGQKRLSREGGMCCGYYQKIIDRKISMEDFYKKRSKEQLKHKTGEEIVDADIAQQMENK